jgi:hypothetical protein
MSEMDFSGFDNAALGALETDLDAVGLEDVTDGMSLPDPVDDVDGTDLSDADVADLDLGGDNAGDDATGWAAADPQIVASDGTTYDGYADFLRGPGPGRG